MSWTDERVATLTKLWAEGLSASTIAAELGGVTRNAVIGKVHRLGLSGRAKPTGGAAKRARATSNKATYSAGTKKRAANSLTTKPNGTSAPAKSVVASLTEPKSKCLSLVDLTDKTCKWPHGDPAERDFHFCGHRTEEESPYCDYHSKLAYQPTSDKRREKRTATA